MNNNSKIFLIEKISKNAQEKLKEGNINEIVNKIPENGDNELFRNNHHLEIKSLKNEYDRLTNNHSRLPTSQSNKMSESEKKVNEDINSLTKKIFRNSTKNKEEDKKKKTHQTKRENRNYNKTYFISNEMDIKIEKSTKYKDRDKVKDKIIENKKNIEEKESEKRNENFEEKNVFGENYIKEIMKEKFSEDEKELSLKCLKFLNRKENYITKIENMTQEKRSSIIDSLQNCCQTLGFSKNTFYLSIELFDTFLSKTKQKINIGAIELIGITCLNIAHKIEELMVYRVDYFWALCQNFSTKELILSTEQAVIKDLKWEINLPTLLSWINLHTTMWDCLVDNIKEYDFDYPKFRDDEKLGDQLLIKLYHLTDIICLDYQFMFLQFKYLSLACLIIIIGETQNVFNEEIFSNISEYSINLPDINLFMRDILNLLQKYLYLDKSVDINYYLIYVINFVQIKFDYSKEIKNHWEKHSKLFTKEQKRQFQNYYSDNLKVINEVYTNN